MPRGTVFRDRTTPPEELENIIVGWAEHLAVPLRRVTDTTGTGTLSGVVSGNRGAPEPFTTVCVADSSRCVVAGEDGTFRLDGLRVGAYRLQITAPGRPAILSDAIEVRAGIDQRVEVTAPQLDVLQNSITVVGTASTTPACDEGANWTAVLMQTG